MRVLKSEEKDSKKVVYISLGSNLGEKSRNLKRALEFISSSEVIDIISVSPFYETEPCGYKEQPGFFNCAAKLLTSLEPERLLKELKRIEELMGRKNERKWGPRVIDLDIIFFNDEVLDNEELVIPHPESHKRWFVLKPLNDIEPNFQHPVLNKTVNQLLGELNGKI